VQPSLLDAVRQSAATQREIAQLVVGRKPVLEIGECGDRRIQPMIGTNRMYFMRNVPSIAWARGHRPIVPE
jgi:hypothetical protein